MKNDGWLKAVLALTLFASLCSCPVNAEERWAKTYGGLEEDGFIGIDQTTDGGYIACGITYSYGLGNDDAWVVKLDGSGDIQWQKTFGGLEYDYFGSGQQTMDGGYILGGYTSSYGSSDGDIWIMKLDENGNAAWQKAYDIREIDDFYSIHQTKDGGYIAVGETWAINYEYDIFALRINGSGDLLWVKIIEAENGYGSWANDVYETEQGEFIIFGAYGSDVPWIIKLSPSGNVIWQKIFNAYLEWIAGSIHPTNDGCFILTDTIFTEDPGNDDAWLAKLDADGNILWQKAYGLEGYEYCARALPTLDGGYVLGASTDLDFTGGYSFMILKLDEGGDIVWQKLFSEAKWESSPSCIQQTRDGSYVMTGVTSTLGSGREDAIFLKLDAFGEIGAECQYLSDGHVRSADTTATPSSVGMTSSSPSIGITNTAAVGIDAEGTVITICHANTTDPEVDVVTKLSSPFRLKLSGSNFHSDLQVFIGKDTSPWPTVVFKNEKLLLLKGGNSLKNKFPKGVPVEIKVVNGDGGSATVRYTR